MAYARLRRLGTCTNSGFFANAGVGFNLAGMPGFSTNLTSAGLGWSQRGGVFAYGAGMTVSRGGDVDFNPSIGYAYGFTSSRQAIPGGPSTADITRDADGYLTAETTEIIGHINYSSNGPWEYGNFYAGLAFSGLEATPGSFRMGTAKQGFSPAYYANAWRGNQYATTYNLGNLGKALGKGLFGLSFVMDAKGVINYYDNPSSSNAVNPGKAILNTGFGAYGIWVNPIAGTLYTGVDILYPGGWIGALNQMSYLQSANQAIIGNSFKLVPSYKY